MESLKISRQEFGRVSLNVHYTIPSFFSFSFSMYNKNEQNVGMDGFKCYLKCLLVFLILFMKYFNI